MKKEWNISYAMHDGNGGLNEFLIVLPCWWKVILWFLRRGRRCCDIYIWTSARRE